MDNFQKIEQLVNKAGCSYEDAKIALEACDWDMIDAIVSLERDGKVKRETVEQTAAKPDDTAKTDSEVKAEKQGSSSKAKDAGNTEDTTKRLKRLWERLKGILFNNRMIVIGKSGKEIMDLPIVIPVIALIPFFWSVIVIAVVAMLFGCRFHFEGEDLGKASINNTMDKATDYAEKVKNDLTGKKDEQDSDN